MPFSTFIPPWRQNKIYRSVFFGNGVSVANALPTFFLAGGAVRLTVNGGEPFEFLEPSSDGF